ncbi:MAG: hypothetical protein GY832_12150 [Chloroflexi bacterium]|nr:hypothetical protein [Chloroflexota bacterium]
MNTRQSENAGTTNQRRVPILSIFVTLDAFVLGGLVALFMVNGLLSDHLARYAQGNFMAEGSTILDLMDNLLIYFGGYIIALLAFLLITAVIWVWLKTPSQTLRYGAVLLAVLTVLVIAIALGGRMIPTTPSPPHLTPTPIAAVGKVGRFR